jgi:uncharacterized oxidoreductase
MDHLVESSLMGLDSHGILRLPDYVNLVLSGRVQPGGALRVVRESAVTALVDCGFNFGQVTARRMTDMACDKAALSGLGCVASQNGMHIGRVGAYVQQAALRGFVAIGMVNGPLSSQRVLPFGGRDPRLSTNPIAFGAPTAGDPIMLDMATCAMPEGKVRLAMQQGKTLPDDVLVDADAQPTHDPSLLYAKSPGALLPLGGPLFGYKGYGLSMMVEVLAGLLGGASAPSPQRYHNGFWILALDPDVFCGRERFDEVVNEMVAHLRSSTPLDPTQPVRIAGEPEFRRKREREVTGIPVAAETWRLILEAGARVGVAVAW